MTLRRVEVSYELQDRSLLLVSVLTHLLGSFSETARFSEKTRSCGMGQQEMLIQARSVLDGNYQDISKRGNLPDW